jgi:hypothetical protein
LYSTHHCGRIKAHKTLGPVTFNSTVSLNQLEKFISAAQCGKHALSTMLHQAICKFLEILGLDSDAYDNNDVEQNGPCLTKKIGSN